MNKKDFIIGLLVGALVTSYVPQAKAFESDGYSGARVIASAMIKSAKIIGLGASCANTGGALQADRYYGQSYWNFVKMIPEDVK